MKQIYLMPNRCMGCEECLVACEKVHEGEARAYVEVVDGFFPFPMRCSHCQDAPCKAACPTDAIVRSASGTIVVQQEQCIGCGTCALVCPFGVPYVSEVTGKIVKCDLCDQKVASGGEPVCVTSCPKGALAFGENAQATRPRRQRAARMARAALWP